MKSPLDFSSHRLCLFGATILLALPMTGATVQQSQSQEALGIVDDWTSRHVIFANPGTSQDAMRNGKYDRWARIVTNPRYRMQWVKRYAAPALAPVGGSPGLDGPRGVARDRDFEHRKKLNPAKGIQIDWAQAIETSGSTFGVAPGMYPAKYTFAPIGTPDCTVDFVVFPVDGAGGASQADIVGANNLYKTTCTGTVPSLLFAYDVGTGVVQTSPALSLDGDKVAFVESISGGSIFHVLTLDKSGNSGCPATPCNGAAFDTPATPGVNNSAVDTKLTMTGGVSVTRSSPFIDYANDVAYVGDDSGKLHKFTGVFNGTPTEAGSPWPFATGGGALTGATYDSVSGNIFVNSTSGVLYCVTSAGASCATGSFAFGTSLLDAPIVDSTNQTVFVTGQSGGAAAVGQVTTSMANPVVASAGTANADQSFYDGTFDNAYFNDVSTGHMYYCGGDASGFNTLYRVSFNAAGTMANAPDAGTFALTTGAQVNCTPLTEVFNTAQSADYLFLGVTNNGFTSGTPNCSGGACIMSFVLPTSTPFTFPTTANATFTLNLGTNGMSGIIIDNVSGTAGASQIYFGNDENSTGVQASQQALQ